MRISVGIAMFLLTVSAVFNICAAAPGGGLFEYSLPTQDMTGLNTAEVKDMTETLLDAGDAGYGWVTGIATIGLNIIKILLNAIYFIPMLDFFGVPMPMPVGFQTMVYIIYLVDLVDWARNAVPN